MVFSLSHLTYLLFGIICGGVAIFIWKKNTSFHNETLLSNREGQLLQLNQNLENSRDEIKNLQKNNADLQSRCARLETELEQQERILVSQKEHFENTKKDLWSHFEVMATEILDKKKDLMEKESNKNLDSVLNPLKERIQEFQKRVEDNYSTELKERHSLKNEISKMFEINRKLEKEAQNLVHALKGDVKVQGMWGELVLESILKNSGLIEGREYISQGKDLDLISHEGRKQKPDVVIVLPNNRHVIIDSKVSLVHYERYSSATDESEKETSYGLFLRSVRSHIDDLSGKNYQHLDGLTSPDYVLMFLPIEGAYSLIFSNDTSLFQYAWEKNILLVGPVNIMATLKTISNFWKHENQNKNALIISKEAGRLYDKFAGFIDDLKALGDSLEKSQSSYHNAYSKLTLGKGNLLSKIETLKKLGAKVSKELPESNEDHDITLI